MNHPKLRFATLAAVSLALLAGCSSAPTAQRYDDILAHRERNIDIEIHGDVVRACELDSSRTYFSYASADLSDDDRALLQDVARCLTDGRLAGRSILVSGYTDKTGTAADNKDLGMSRSTIVALQLNTFGLPAHRIFLRSRGERVASGDDADGRALDRKVELRIVERDI